MCDALGVSRSGFFAWLRRAPSARAQADEEIGAEVRASFLQSDRTYGARRVWKDVLEAGIAFGLHRIEKIMRQQAFRARPRRRRSPPDTALRNTAAIAPNTLDRQFEAQAPNQKWAADFTYIWTAEGWLYVAVVLDLKPNVRRAKLTGRGTKLRPMSSITSNASTTRADATRRWAISALPTLKRRLNEANYTSTEPGAGHCARGRA
jgi:hypothetical protein